MPGQQVTDPAAERPPGVAWRMRLGFVLAGAVVMLATAGATVGVGVVQLHQIAHIVQRYGHRETFKRGTITPPPAGKPQTLLLVGSDRRYGDPRGSAHSDTLMLARLDPHQEAITVLSIPRDLRVDIPGHGISKINAAYGEGGLDLTTRTLKQLLSYPGHPFKVNHAIAVNFKGFREAVDIVHCVYVDVDRRYYHSNVGVPIGERYAEINIQPGYQKLCGQRALSYVRFRHLDNDVVRAARQQDFLRAAADQVSGSRLLFHLKSLVKAFAKSTSTDANLQTSRGILRLLELAASTAGRPVHQIRFPATFVNQAAPATGTGTTAPVAGLGDYVTATQEQIRRTVARFMHPTSPPTRKPSVPSPRSRSRHRHHRAPVTAASYHLVDALSAAKALVRPAIAGRHLHLPFYAPAWLTSSGQYPPSTSIAPSPRLYTIVDRSGHRHRAYRLVIAQNAALGQYYGVQGMTWTDPPIIDGSADGTIRMGGHRFELFYDGSHLRVVVWRTPRGVYWVSNTLSRSLSNRQMLGIARSLTRIR